MFEDLVNELNNMVNELGYNDFIAYLRANKGDEYAQNAEANLINLFGSLTNRGSDNVEPGYNK